MAVLSEAMSRRAVIAFIRQAGTAEERKHALEYIPLSSLSKVKHRRAFSTWKVQLLVPEVMISAFRLSKIGQRLNYLKLPLQFGSQTCFPVIQGFFSSFEFKRISL